MDKLGEKRNLSLLFSQEAHTTDDYPLFLVSCSSQEQSDLHLPTQSSAR